MRSTPAVFLPLFSVTRRTARTLPLYEQVSRRCKAFTLFHRPALIAPSSQTPLLGPGPLRTVHASFPAHSSSTANASFRETRLGYGKVLTVNPVVALWMK